MQNVGSTGNPSEVIMTEHIFQKGKKSRVQTVSLPFVQSTLTDQYTDEADTVFFNNFPYIPYSLYGGVVAQRLLYLLDNMKVLSSTQGDCHQEIRRHTFNRPYAITSKSSLYERAKPIEDDTNEYKEFIASINFENGGEEDIKDFEVAWFDQQYANGNAFVLLSHTETLGEKKTFAKVLPTSSVRYRKGQAQGARWVGVSNDWGKVRFVENKYTNVTHYPIFPNFKELADGTKISVIHSKNGSGVYGRPTWLQAFQDCWSEYKHTQYLAVMAERQFVGQVLIEVEDGDIKNDLPNDDELEDIKSSWTMDSDNPDTVIFMTRPYGAKPVTVHEFSPNTNESYWQTIEALLTKKIIRANGWSHRLLGDSVGEGFSTDSYMSELRAKEKGVLSDIRKDFLKLVNTVIDSSAKFKGVEFPYNLNYLIEGETEI